MHNLREQKVGIAVKQVTHRSRGMLQLLQSVDRHLQCWAANLNLGAGISGLVTAADDAADGAFAPDRRDLYAASIFEEKNEGCDRAGSGEIGELHVITHLTEYHAAFQLNELASPFKSYPIVVRQRCEQAVAHDTFRKRDRRCIISSHGPNDCPRTPSLCASLPPEHVQSLSYTDPVVCRLLDIVLDSGNFVPLAHR